MLLLHYIALRGNLSFRGVFRVDVMRAKVGALTWSLAVQMRVCSSD
jgi:hypothetical protein